MKHYHFCTITTYSYLYKVYALRDSLLFINQDITLHVLLVDATVENENAITQENIVWNTLKDLHSEIGQKIIRKYANDKDKLRWSLKPVFLQYLLETNVADKLIYLDNDIAFFNDFEFLFDELNHYNILLTPHHYPIYTHKMQNWLEANFRVGLYNAGFIAANKHAIQILEWWASACFYRCEKSAWRGLFDDQKYLDLVPILEPKTLVLHHQGCNVAEWNREVCKRTTDNQGNILINGKWPVVFIHFNKTTMQCFLNGEDEQLNSYFHDYTLMLEKYNPQFNITNTFTWAGYFNTIKLKIWQLINYLN